MNIAQRTSEALLNHVDYPHEPGYLYDCPGCEQGPCVCVGDDSLAPCLSERCERPDDPDPDDGGHHYWYPG